jgi:hypothetical protein
LAQLGALCISNLCATKPLHGENGFVKDINKAQELLIILKNKKNILSETLLNYINEY